MSASNAIKVNNYQRPIDLIDIANRNAVAKQGEVKGQSFKEMFSAQLAGERNLSVSKHAHQRLFSRGIELNDTRLNQIADAIDKAEAKGSRDTLILSDEAAYVVSVKDRTVVTVFDPNHLKEGVVTSIDSAVII